MKWNTKNKQRMSGGECLALKSIWLVAMAVLGVQPTTQSQTTLFHSFSYKMVAVVRFYYALRWIVRWSLENRVTRRRILLFYTIFLFCTERYRIQPNKKWSKTTFYFIFFGWWKEKLYTKKWKEGFLKNTVFCSVVSFLK